MNGDPDLVYFVEDQGRGMVLVRVDVPGKLHGHSRGDHVSAHVSSLYPWAERERELEKYGLWQDEQRRAWDAEDDERRAAQGVCNRQCPNCCR